MMDVLGMRLDAAEEQLRREAVPYRISETEPFARTAVEGPLRVIRAVAEDGIWLLTVCKVPIGSDR